MRKFFITLAALIMAVVMVPSAEAAKPGNPLFF